MEQKRDLFPDYAEAAALLDSSRNELGRRIVGQGEMIDGILMALVAGGHILLEGVPGLAKTLAVKSLADITGLLFRRIQFTPDLLPADLTGTMVWEQGRGIFSVRRGPVFANVLLADEINRAPAKVQSALLEAMEERQVTIGETTYALPEPFFVLATQNPIEHEGTYALPEAQLDRFLLKLLVRYPGLEEEIRVLERDGSGIGNPGGGFPPLGQVLGIPALEFLRRAAGGIRLDPVVARYIVSVVAATRPSGRSAFARHPAAEDSQSGPGFSDAEGLYRYIAFGASPRASIALYRCCRIRALFEGRNFADPEDVKAMAYPVLRHRIVLSYEAEADGLDADDIISRILSLVPVP
ncbi:MAG: AAA family ATPase [Spirochaetaceae bacterium]|jgi:MoxR-like ATPase|nr:AAA family ATPase [Spirochaetaceae bacterium]